MKKSLKRRIVDPLVQILGRPLRDERTGAILGKALVIPWGGRVWVVGLHRPYLRPLFLSQTAVRYARHRLGFATHAPVDFSRVRPAPGDDGTARILKVIIVHQSAAFCTRLVDYWTGLGFAGGDILLVHGGARGDFEQLTHPAVFVDDPRLRTTRHPVEHQSYGGVMRAAAAWMKGRGYTHVLLAEYDHLPVQGDWDTRLLECAQREKADVLFPHVERVDGTNAPHYLEHLSHGRFEDLWDAVSVREDRGVVLNALPTGSFWTAEAFSAVASLEEKWPVYLEMLMPSAAHHFGFRVRAIPSQGEFVGIEPLPATAVERARQCGAWSIHPVKEAFS